MIALGTLIGKTQDQIASDLGGEVVVLNIQHGIYYGVDDVGVTIWQLLDQPRTPEAIRDAVLAKYDVDPEECERDLLRFLEQLLNAGLIEVRDAGHT